MPLPFREGDRLPLENEPSCCWCETFETARLAAYAGASCDACSMQIQLSVCTALFKERIARCCQVTCKFAHTRQLASRYVKCHTFGSSGSIKAWRELAHPIV